MNGCMLLVLLALAGQVGQGLPAGQVPLEDNVSFRSTEYGWKINPKTNELEYIVQISPEKANVMVREDKEFASEVHPEVAVRTRKIVVRIGSETIESLPLNMVRQLPPVAAPLETNVQSEVGKGRFAQLESGVPAELKNVGGGTPPPSLPTGGMAASLSDAPGAPDSMPDAFKNPDNLIAQNTIDSFLNGTRGATPNSSAGSKFSNTGTTPATAPPSLGAGGIAGTPQLPGSPGNFPTSPVGNLPGSQLPGSLTGAGQLPTGGSPGFGQSTAPLAGSPGTPNYSNVPSYTNAPAYNGGQTTTTGNFGAPPRSTSVQPGGYATTPMNNNYGQGQIGTGSPFVQHTDPPSYLPSTRIADNRGLPTTSGAGVTGNMATSGYGVGTGTGSASDLHAGDTRGFQGGGGVSRTGGQAPYVQPTMNDYQRTGMENIVPVMFVLSLVVNFYLGMLIRKLLGRYRTLLASVRSQTV